MYMYVYVYMKVFTSNPQQGSLTLHCKNRMWTYISMCVHSSGHNSDPSKQVSVEQRRV